MCELNNLSWEMTDGIRGYLQLVIACFFGEYARVHDVSDILLEIKASCNVRDVGGFLYPSDVTDQFFGMFEGVPDVVLEQIEYLISRSVIANVFVHLETHVEIPAFPNEQFGGTYPNKQPDNPTDAMAGVDEQLYRAIHAARATELQIKDTFH